MLIAAGVLSLRDERSPPSPEFPQAPAASAPGQRGDSAAGRTPSPPVTEGPGLPAARLDAPAAIGVGVPRSGAAEHRGGDEDPIASLRHAAAERFYRDAGDELVDDLVAHGLARSDAEITVRGLADAYVSCYFEALRAEADAQSVSFFALLDAVQAAVYDADGPLIGGLIEEERLNARVVPCALDAMQQAGIPLPSQ